MRHRHVLLAAMLALAPLSGARADDTTLTLSETATVMAAPDELAAEMRAEATTATAAEAQRSVNAAMADALARAKDTAGVTASTGGYSVYRDMAAKPERWRASQTLALRGPDGAALLTLVGALQDKGLVVGDLHWQLSNAAARKAEAEATRRAIGALRARVDEAAALLDLHFVRFVTVRLDTAPSPRPMMRMMATAAPAAAATPPSVTAEDIPVSSTVGADAVLAPK
jgi:uncharacterized protein